MELTKFINVIINPVGDKCNLKCNYCYTKLTTRSAETDQISETQVIELLKFLVEESDFNRISLTWHGGEPLLYPKLKFKDIMERVYFFTSSKSINTIIQTNGLLIDKEWIDLFKKYDVSVGVSLDGSTYNDNRSRFDSEHQFLTVVRNIEQLINNNIFVSIYTTLTKEVLMNLNEFFAFLDKIKPNLVSFVPIISETNYLNREEYKEALIKMYNKNKKSSYKITNIEVFSFDRPYFIPSLCLYNGLCNSFISMDTIGNIYRTCTLQNDDTYITTIGDKQWKNKLKEFQKKPLEEMEDSIFHRSGDDPRLIFYQGNGCKMCRTLDNNEELIQGVISFLKYILGGESYGNFKMQRC